MYFLTRRQVQANQKFKHIIEPAAGQLPQQWEFFVLQSQISMYT